MLRRLQRRQKKAGDEETAGDAESDDTAETADGEKRMMMLRRQRAQRILTMRKRPMTLVRTAQTRTAKTQTRIMLTMRMKPRIPGIPMRLRKQILRTAKKPIIRMTGKRMIPQTAEQAQKRRRMTR